MVGVGHRVALGAAQPRSGGHNARFLVIQRFLIVVLTVSLRGVLPESRVTAYRPFAEMNACQLPRFIRAPSGNAAGYPQTTKGANKTSTTNLNGERGHVEGTRHFPMHNC